MPERNLDENSLNSFREGPNKASERKILLFPRRPLSKLLVGDFIQIPWGTRPNTVSPYNAPDNLGPCIILNTPTGFQELEWNGTQFVGSTITLNYDPETEIWCFTGEIDICLPSGNLRCQTFPIGYTFVRNSGPYIDMEIIRLNPQIDHLGRISHYVADVEYKDKSGEIIQ